MEYAYGFIVLLLFFSEVNGKRKWETLPDTEDGQSQPIDLINPVGPEARLTYNDERTRMTAIHDSEIHACFITDYDPEWKLDDTEKQSIARSMVAQTVNSPIEFLKFKAQVGDVISSMCKHNKLYWMTRPKVPPRPLQHLVQHGQVPVPQTHHRVTLNVPPPHSHGMSHHNPPPHYGMSALNVPAPVVADSYIVPFKPPQKGGSRQEEIAPGDDIADHYIIPPKRH